MTPDQDINVYRTAFAALKGINPVLAREFLQRTGSEQNFFSATERQLSAVMGFSNRISMTATGASCLRKRAGKPGSSPPPESERSISRTRIIRNVLTTWRMLP